MVFVLSLWDLGLWSAVTALVIIVGCEAVSPHYGRLNMLIDLKKLRAAAFGISTVFILIVLLRIASIINIE